MTGCVVVTCSVDLVVVVVVVLTVLTVVCRVVVTCFACVVVVDVVVCCVCVMTAELSVCELSSGDSTYIAVPATISIATIIRQSIIIMVL